MRSRYWRACAAVLLTLLAVVTLAPAAGASPGHAASAANCRDFIRVIDVSRWQGSIDWPALAADQTAGIAGAWIKAGGADGGYYADPQWANNVRGATAAGLPWGGYFFTEPRNGDGANQARFFVSLGGAKGALVPLVDVETNPHGLTGTEMDRFTADFNHEVTAETGRVPDDYEGAYFVGGASYELAASGLDIPNYPAGYNRNPNPCNFAQPAIPSAWADRGYDGWQFTSSATMAGLGSPTVDESIVTPEAWAQWTGAGVITNPGPDPATDQQQTFGLGSHGPAVARIQQIVGATPDGTFGPATRAAVARWQRFLGITADGTWGPNTETATARLFVALAGHGRPNVYFGSRSQDVCDLQALLDDNGFELDLTCVDDEATNQVLRVYQEMNGLPSDYPLTVAGADTWHSLGQDA